MNKNKIFELSIDDKLVTFEFDKIAKLCDESVIVKCLGTVVLCTLTMSKQKSTNDFLPLIVNYEEKLYAAGKIPGGYIKREGRPTENAILCARLIDRTLRPLFDSEIRNEIQLVVTVLSLGDMNPDVLALLGSSLLLTVSYIPFKGPVGSVKAVLNKNKVSFFPTISESKGNQMELIISGKDNKTLMLEASCQEISEQHMCDYINLAHSYINKFIDFSTYVRSKIGKKKLDLETNMCNQVIIQKCQQSDLTHKIDALVNKLDFKTVGNLTHELNLINKNFCQLNRIEDEYIKDVEKFIYTYLRSVIRNNILENDSRLDKRKSHQIRSLHSEIDFLPRTHGSAIFKRGETQVLNICTLGTIQEDQRFDTLDEQESKKFMLHYNFYPYSTGDVGRIGAVSRREIGHGALGEKSLKHIIPDQEIFPYTIRLVSEVTDSNGSTSQASICSASLALMSAGVPIKKHVAGIAMGLVTDKENLKYKILTDIRGIEDHIGDMDFKIAGTKDGITGLQLDVKCDGLKISILEEIFIKSYRARKIILDNMYETISKYKDKLSPYAPKFFKFKIDPDKIKTVIGPSGRQINNIIEKTKCKITIDQEGNILIYSLDENKLDEAVEMIKDLVKDIKIGDIFLGNIKRIENYGIFVELPNRREALVHMSRITKNKFTRLNDILKLGDTISVRIIDIDDSGRLKAESTKMFT